MTGASGNHMVSYARSGFVRGVTEVKVIFEVKILQSFYI